MKTLRSSTRTFLAAAFALGLGASASVATLTSSASVAAAQERAPAITFRQAEEIARRHVPDATLESIELDYERGVRVYEVELRTADGVEHEILIDANDGHVVDARIDD